MLHDNIRMSRHIMANNNNIAKSFSDLVLDEDTVKIILRDLVYTGEACTSIISNTQLTKKKLSQTPYHASYTDRKRHSRDEWLGSETDGTDDSEYESSHAGATVLASLR